MLNTFIAFLFDFDMGYKQSRSNSYPFPADYSENAVPYGAENVAIWQHLVGNGYLKYEIRFVAKKTCRSALFFSCI